MPAVTQAKTPCIAQLASELGYASKPTLLRHLQRIDEMGPQIDPDGVYPEDWIIFRITAYRPDIDSPALVPGAALRGDLSAIAEHISEHAKLSPDDLDEPTLSINDLTERWSVSRKTIERYRRLGLIARRLDLGKGRRSIVFIERSVEWFESLNADRLGNAARFDRIPETQLQRFRRWAIGYRSKLGWSRSQAAARIAIRTGHSHEGVRKALLRLDRTTDAPIFDEPGPTSSRDQVFAFRASIRGVEPAVIAERTGRSHNAILRAINHARVSLIESYNLRSIQHNAPDGNESLESPAVTDGLLTTGTTDLRELIDTMRVREPAVIYEERSRSQAYVALITQALELFDTLDRAAPSSPVLDEIETRLRFAGKLKIELVRSQLHLAMSTIEHQIGGAIDTLDPSRASFLLLNAIQIISGTIDRFDPSHGSRLAAPIGLAITRFASLQPDIAQPTSTGKAMRRIPLGHWIRDWTTLVNPWDRWLMLDRRCVGIIEQLELRDRIILTRKFGLDGEAPCARVEIAKLIDTTALHCARFERVAIRAGLELMREQALE